jgi:signal peptidase II
MNKKYIKQSVFRYMIMIGGLLITIFIINVWIKTHMFNGEEIIVFSWLRLHFIENDMNNFILDDMIYAFGSDNHILMYSMIIIRSTCAILLLFLLFRSIKNRANKTMSLGICLIVSGAISNLISNFFYGLLFSDSFNKNASFLPSTGSYGTLFHGKAIDFLYFPVIQYTIPSWVPFYGGTEIDYFREVFGISDILMFLGITIISTLIAFHFSTHLRFESKSYNKRKPKSDFLSIEEMILSTINYSNITRICPVYASIQFDVIILTLLLVTLGCSYIESTLANMALFISLILFIIYSRKNYIEMLLRRRKKILDLLVLTDDSLYLLHFITIDKNSKYHINNIYKISRKEIILDKEIDIIEFIPDKIDAITSLITFYLKNFLSSLKGFLFRKVTQKIGYMTKSSVVKIRLKANEKLVISSKISPVNSFSNYDIDYYEDSSYLKYKLIDFEYLIKYLGYQV